MEWLSRRLLVFPLALIALPISAALLNTGCAAVAHAAVLTPPATVEIDPKTLFDEAQALQEIGEYQAARERYRAIVSQSPSSVEAAGARYNLGVIAYQLGEYAAAAEAFTQFRARHLSHAQANLALFWLAESQRQRGEDRAALAAYDEFLRYYPQVEDQVRLKRAQVPSADKTAELSAAAASGTTPELRRRYADALLAQGQGAAAAQVYRELYDNTASSWAKSELLYLMAQGQKGAGDGRYLNNLAEVVRSHPSSYYAKLSLDAVLQNPSAGITPYQEGRVRYFQREDAAALEAFQRQLRLHPASGETPWARYRLALIYERLGRNDDALRELDVLVRDYSGEPAQEGLWEKGLLLDYLGRHEEASAIYRDFYARFPGVDRSRDALFKEGLSLFRAGNVRAAAQVWNGVAPEAAGSTHGGRTAMWLGKAREALGDRAGAEQAYQQAREARPGRYYSQRAEALRLGAAGTRAFSYQPLDPSISPGEATETKAWIAQWSPASPLQGIGGRVERGILLSDMGLRNEAGQEFRSVIKAMGQDHRALYDLALFLHERREYGAAIAAATVIWEAAPERDLARLPRGLLKLLYPVPFGPQVVSAAKEWNVDPLLLYALMKQESLFNPAATSVASAKGLTQVIPSTGQEIAQNLKLSSFSSDDLYRPALSIRFGAYYLSKQLEYLGNPHFAAAAYNAGAGSALRWMGNDKYADPDLFVENIDYSETSYYVRIVIENYGYYRLLYGER